MIRPGDLAQYAPLVGGEAAMFFNSEPRLVRLSLSAPAPVAVAVLGLTKPEDDHPEFGDELFAFKADGLEDVEFYVQGAFALMHDGERIYLQCKDGDQVAIEVVDAETFTTLYERRPRNPEIEALQEMLIRNQNRKFAAMYEDIENERERLAREREALDQRAGAAGADSAPAKPADGAGEPARSATKDGAGTEGGKSDA